MRKLRNPQQTLYRLRRVANYEDFLRLKAEVAYTTGLAHLPMLRVWQTVYGILEAHNHPDFDKKVIETRILRFLAKEEDIGKR